MLAFLTGTLAAAKQIPWRLVALIGVGLLVALLMDMASRVERERARADAAEAIAKARADSIEAVAEVAREFNANTRNLNRNLAAGREHLEAVPHDASDQTYLLVWARADRSLRNEPAASNNNRA